MIWERWDGIKPDGTFQSASMNSLIIMRMAPSVIGCTGRLWYRDCAEGYKQEYHRTGINS